MNTAQILEILQDWNVWTHGLESGIPRPAYVERCLRLLNTNVIIAITGVRRSGKSHIMRQLIKKLIEQGTNPKDTLMINFEDSRIEEFSPALLSRLYETYIEHLQPGKKPYVFLDEVHNVPKWERWVRSMHELGKAKMVVSGSSAKLLSGELATTLTGRHLDITVTPLSFAEFLDFKGVAAHTALDIAKNRIVIQRLFSSYMQYGGFPEVVLSTEKKQLLLTYVDDILTKDIEKRHKVRETETLRALARFYLSNSSGTITFNSLRKFLSTTTNTVEKFSSYLEEANLIFFVKRFSFKVKEQEKSARKVYAADTGLAGMAGFTSSHDTGKTAETIIAIELKRRAKAEGSETYYWHDQQNREVDFVIKKGKKAVQLIQASWDVKEYKTKERETKALIKAGRELKCSNLLVLTGDYEQEEKVDGARITFLPLWKWLLAA